MLRSSNERGVALGAVIIMSVLIAIGAFGVMLVATSRGQTSAMHADRLRAKYAAEAGMVWAMQQLWRDPRWSSDEDRVNPDVTINGVDVDVITLPSCRGTPPPPCPSNRTLRAQVNYERS